MVFSRLLPGYMHQRQVNIDCRAARQVVAELADRFHEGHGLDVTHVAADFADDEIIVLIALDDEILDLVRDMGNDLHGRAEIVAAAFLVDDVLVDPAGGDVVGLRRRTPGKALVVARSRSVSAPSSVTNTSPCCVGLIVPGSTLR